MSVRLRVLGGLSLTRDGAVLGGAAGQRRSLALLALLAVHERLGISRDRLAALLHPERSEASARNSLKQAVFVVRRELGAEVIQGSTELRLCLDVISCDLAEFERALARNDLAEAVGLYGGPFLDGFHLSGDSLEFDRWAESERARLGRRRDQALEALAERAVANGDDRAAVGWWQLLAESVPLDSRYAHRVASTLLALGDRAGAVQHIERHRGLLGSELGLPLGADLERLLDASRRPSTQPEQEALPMPMERPTRTEVVLHSAGTSDRPPLPRLHERSHWPRTSLLMGVMSLATAMVLAVWKYSSSPPTRLDPRRVALISTVHASDGAYPNDLTRFLVEAIARRLAKAEVVDLTMRVASPGADAGAAARQAGAQYVVTITASGTARGSAGTPLDAAITDVQQGVRLWGTRLDTADRAHIERMAERTAVAVMTRVDPRVSNWIDASSEPTTVEAYRDLVDGLALLADLRPAEAARRFRSAAGDSSFTMARVLVAWAEYYAGRWTVADSSARAMRTRALPPLERAMVELQLAMVARDLDAQYQASRAVAMAAPRSEWRFLLAETSVRIGHGRESVRILDEIGPDLGFLRGSFWYWVWLSRALHYDGDIERELREMAEARRRFPSNRVIAQAYVKALAASGRIDDVEAEVDRALSLRQRANWSADQPMAQAVSELQAHGYSDGARRIALQTLAWIDEQSREEQERLRPVVPYYLYHAGDTTRARLQLERLTTANPDDWENLALLAVIYAQAGDARKAGRIDTRMRMVTDSVHRVELLVDRAGIAASMGERERAVTLLRDANRAGFEWRSAVHLVPGINALKGYQPYEEFARPSAGLETFTASVNPTTRGGESVALPRGSQRPGGSTP